MKCDICHEVMDEDLTSYYSILYQKGGHIACMRKFLWEASETEGEALEPLLGS